jgi:hypothetical protein
MQYTEYQQKLLQKAEELAINWIAGRCFTEKELKELFTPKELKEFYLFMNYQTVGVDKETNTTYYYITDVRAFIKGLAPLD